MTVANLFLAGAIALSPAFAAAAAVDEEKPLRVLVLTGGGYHDFARNTNRLLVGLQQQQVAAFAFDWVGLRGTEPLDHRYRKADDLSQPGFFERYDAILAYHQGEFEEFTDEVKRRLLDYVRNGGGYVGIHSAADSHPGWNEYDAMLGGRFEHHPPFGEITVTIDVTEHEITRDLPREWTLRDEFYHLKNYNEDDKLVLMHGRSPGDDDDAPKRPVTWEKNYGSGRVFYTILGHGIETHSDERFHQLIARALRWSANAPKPDSQGRYVLFGGDERDLKAWSMAGPGGFRFEDGEIVSYGGMGLLWYHERRFRDFTLTVEWKVGDESYNSGVFMRFPKPSSDPWYSVRHGHEVQIYGRPDAGETRGTGSIYAFADAPEGRDASKPPGEWNRYEITVRGDTYTVVLNGRQILEWDSPTDRHGREGYIGLQNHDDRSPVRFRNISVRALR